MTLVSWLMSTRQRWRTTPAAIWVVAVSLAVSGMPAAALAQESAAGALGITKTLELASGHSSVLSFPAPIDRASVNDEGIADIVVVSPTELLVHGRGWGSTSLIVWYSGKNETYNVRVEEDLDMLRQALKRVLPEEAIGVQNVSGLIILSGEVSSVAAKDEALQIAVSFVNRFRGENESDRIANLLRVRTGKLQKLLAELFPDEKISVHESDDGVVLSGPVSSGEVANRVLTVAEAHSPKVTNLLRVSLQDLLKEIVPDEDLKIHESGDAVIITGTAKHSANVVKAEQAVGASAERVINLVDVPDRKQVLLEVRFIEAKRSVSRAFGLDYFMQARGITNAGFMNGGAGPQVPSTPTFARINPADLTLSQSVNQLLEIRDGSDFTVTLKALEEKGLLHILAEPNLLTMSGQEASFLAGGEFPIPVVQSATSGGNNAVTIEFKEFGIRLDFTPTVLADNTIDIHVEPEVSLLDFATAAVQLGGFQVPGLITRRANTNVHMASGESLVIGGLISQVDTKSGAQLPILGDIPVIGKLFSSEDFQKEETELLVLVTPHLVDPVDMGIPQPYNEPEDVATALNQPPGPPFQHDRSDAIRRAIQEADEEKLWEPVPEPVLPEPVAAPEAEDVPVELLAPEADEFLMTPESDGGTTAAPDAGDELMIAPEPDEEPAAAPSPGGRLEGRRSRTVARISEPPVPGPAEEWSATMLDEETAASPADRRAAEDLAVESAMARSGIIPEREQDAWDWDGAQAKSDAPNCGHIPWLHAQGPDRNLAGFHSPGPAMNEDWEVCGSEVDAWPTCPPGVFGPRCATHHGDRLSPTS